MVNDEHLISRRKQAEQLLQAATDNRERTDSVVKWVEEVRKRNNFRENIRKAVT